MIGFVKSAVPTEEEGGISDLACLEPHPVLPELEADGVLPTAIRAAASGRDAHDERLLSCTRAEVHRVPKPVVRLDMHLVKDDCAGNINREACKSCWHLQLWRSAR